MRIENYIKDLLYRYDCVIVPGLGAFVVKFENAKINSSTNTLFPPRRKLVFNGQLKSDDVLLINYISQKEYLDLEDAKKYLASYVEDLYQVLQIERSFHLKGLGEIQLTEEDQLTFAPSEKHNFHKASFGLSPFQISALQLQTAATEKADIQLQTPVAKTPKKTYLKYAALLIIAVLAGSFGAYLIDQEKQHKHQESLANKAEEKIQQEIQSANFFISRPLPTIEIELKNKQTDDLSQLNYHVIAGAFRNKKNAEKKIKQLQDLDYQARYLGKNNYNLHQVAYQSFAQRSEALHLLKKVRATHQKSAWLFVGSLTHNSEVNK